MAENCNDNSCPADCSTVFSRVRVFPLTRGNTRVEWELHPQFTVAGPYEFQLQVGHTGLNNAEDWEDVGISIEDQYYAIDEDQRHFGRTAWTHYRVIMTAGGEEYISRPESVEGVLSFADWQLARQIIAAESLRLKKTHAGTKGYLLKRRWYGERCDCVNRQTRDIDNPQHLRCYGTGIVDGYYEAQACSYAALDPELRYNETNEQTGTTNNGPVVSARMLAIPQLFSGDIWVNATSDERWVMHSIKSIAEVRAVPLVVSVEFKLLPFKDVAYDFPLDD